MSGVRSLKVASTSQWTRRGFTFKLLGTPISDSVGGGVAGVVLGKDRGVDMRAAVSLVTRDVFEVAAVGGSDNISSVSSYSRLNNERPEGRLGEGGAVKPGDDDWKECD